jgi:L-iditol 2-dehydrogenase
MRSIQLLAPRVLEERLIPDPPDPAQGEVLVRNRAVGLCGSDMHWYLDGRIGHSPAVYPQILGHEPVAEIVRLGAGVAGFREGQRVTVEPTISCGHCENCLAGAHNNCTTQGFFMGGPQAHGFFREFAVVPERNLTPVPDWLNDRQAALIEPVAVMAHMLDLVSIRPGDIVAVTGAGPIGIMCAAVARASGAGKVFNCDRVFHRLEMAMNLGADMACDIDSFPSLVRDETRGRGADIVFEAAGSPQAINMAISVARPTGTVVLIGITSEAAFEIDIHTAMAKELSLRTLKRSNHCAAKAIRILKRGFINDKIVTHTFPLERTPEAFHMLSEYADGVGKIIIEIRK